MFDLGAVFVTFKAKTDEFVSGLNQVKSSLGTAATNVANIGMKVVKFGAAAATAFYGAATAAGFFAVKSAGDFQQARIAFETMLGSAEKAGKLLQQVSDFAAKTPFELPQVVEGAKKLLAYNIEAEKIIPTFNSLGNIAAGVGKDKLPQLIMAFGQVKAATRLTGMELRQFTEAGVPLLDILAKQMGKTTAEMVEMISDGKVGFPEVEKAIFGMSAEGGKFFNLMERQSKTFDGVMSNLRDNIGRVARNVIGLTDTGEVVKGGFFDKLSTAASNLLMWFDKNRESIIAFLQNGLNVLLSVGQQVINVVTTLYGWVKTLIDGFRSGEGTFGYVAAIFQTIWDWIKQVADTIKGPLIEAWERMKSAVQPILPLLQALAVVFGAILFGAIMGFISLLGFLIETVSRIFSGIVQIVSGALQVIQGLFEIVTGFFIGLLTGDWEQFRQGWANLWNGIKNIFVGAWNAITGIFQAAWNAVKNIFTTMFNFLIGHSIVPDIVNGIIGWFSRIPSGIANALRNVGSAIASPFQRGFDLIKAGVDKVRGFLQRINPFHRESPSLVDNITKGVDVILRQYDKIASMEIQRPIVPEPILSSQPVANTGSSIIVNIERSLIANDAAAQDIGELVGDAILKKLHNSVKV